LMLLLASLQQAFAYNTYCLETWNFEERWRDTGIDNSWIYWNDRSDTVYPGWQLRGGAGFLSKQTWNMIDGGFIQFSMDTANAQTNVNNNFYMTTPNSQQFGSKTYCDVQRSGYDDDENCLELDIQENNGNCRSHLGVHTWPDHNGGCDQGGCLGQANIQGKRTYRLTFNSEGGFKLKYQLEGKHTWYPLSLTDHISGGGRTWTDAKARIKQLMESNGFQIHSSQWEGWVPTTNAAEPPFDSNLCTNNGGIEDSYFYIWNVIVRGAIVQSSDTHPPKCSSDVIARLDDLSDCSSSSYTCGPIETLVHSHSLSAAPVPDSTTTAPSTDSEDSEDEKKHGPKKHGHKGPKKGKKGPKKHGKKGPKRAKKGPKHGEQGCQEDCEEEE